jgi:NAD+ kinase
MRKLRSAVVVSNPRKPKAAKAAKKVRAFLKSKGVRPVKGHKADALILVGGDGTLLYNKKNYDLPMLGIGTKNSAICKLTMDNWRKKLPKILKGFKTESRSMLSCKVKGMKTEDALNDVVIRSRDHRVIDIQLQINKKKFDFYADGVLFSTPTGSTAYCYSCGGRKLSKHAPNYEVAAIAPYKRAFKPRVLPGRTICVASTKSSTADLVIDGQFIHALKPNSKVRVSKSRKAVRLIQV